MLITSSVVHYIEGQYVGFHRVGYKLKNLKKEDTYAVIFGPGQDSELEFLENQKNINILYKAPRAVNLDHGPRPRNTLVIFELKDE